MATRRHRQAIRGGRVRLSLASVSALPYADASFDVAFAINSVQFWPEPVEDLKEVRRVLRPGGRLAIGVQLPTWIRSAAELERLGRAVEQQARAAGFRGVARAEREVQGMPTTRVIGRK